MSAINGACLLLLGLSVGRGCSCLLSPAQGPLGVRAQHEEGGGARAVHAGLEGARSCLHGSHKD